LLGITVLGAILSARQNAVTGTPLHRYLEGYQFALMIAAALLAVGVPISLAMLRRMRPAAPAGDPQPQPALSAA